MSWFDGWLVGSRVDKSMRRHGPPRPRPKPKPRNTKTIGTISEPDGRTSFKVTVAGKDLEMKVRGEVELTLDGVTYTVRSNDQD